MWSEGWDDLFSRVEWGRYPGEELIRFVARNFYNVKNRMDVNILEIGCGTGANLWFFAREGFSVFGIDGSKVAIERAEKFLKLEDLSVNLKVGDAMNLPYEDLVFDAVVDVECLYANSRADTSVILKEAYRVLKQGGLIYSKTFSTEMSGKETGIFMEGEENTFLKMPDGPLHDDYGLIRLTSEIEIPIIYNLFNDIQIDSISRTDKNRTKNISEWIIQGRKY